MMGRVSILLYHFHGIYHFHIFWIDCLRNKSKLDYWSSDHKEIQLKIKETKTNIKLIN